MTMPVVHISQTPDGPVITVGAMGVVHLAFVRSAVAEPLDLIVRNS